jgi:hypothetical protein
MTDITISLVLTDGSVDVDASIAVAEDTIRSFAASQRADEETIKSSLDQVFDTRPGVKMNMPFVINQTLTLMGVSEQPTNYKTLYERVHGYIASNSQGKTDKETKLVERPESYFVVGKGKGGGVARRADLNAAQVDDVATS